MLLNMFPVCVPQEFLSLHLLSPSYTDICPFSQPPCRLSSSPLNLKLTKTIKVPWWAWLWKKKKKKKKSSPSANLIYSTKFSFLFISSLDLCSESPAQITYFLLDITTGLSGALNSTSPKLNLRYFPSNLFLILVLSISLNAINNHSHSSQAPGIHIWLISPPSPIKSISKYY